MNLFQTMSFNGSLFLLFALAAESIGKRFLTGKCLYRLYKIALLCFLLPLQYLKYYYMDILYALFSVSWKDISFHYIPGYGRLLHIPLGNHTYAVVSSMVYITFTIIVFPAVLASGIYLFKYFKVRRELRRHSSLRRNYCTEKNNRYACYENKNLQSPLAFGILHPKIFFPATKYTKEEQQWIYTHESCHLHHRDTLIRLLWILAFSFHWYNPLIYVLYRKLTLYSELACDEHTVLTMNMDRSQRQAYAAFLIHTSSRKTLNRKDSIFSSHFFGDPKLLKRRIINLSMMKKSKTAKYVAAIASGICILASSALSVYAYSPVKTEEYSHNLEAPAFSEECDVWYFIPGSPEELAFFRLGDPCYGISLGNHDSVYLSENGTIIERIASKSSAERAACAHSFQTITRGVHEKNSNGGCTMKYYNVQVCRKCGHEIVTSLQNSVTYAVCPHK